ncbi:protein kinase [Streptomyces sp. NPDC001339]|uniref:serine/threonine-protein kinase n=1 Tax=Streptomyces sp. NPDC001339 TaxID=3364563 RepID=UPI0036973F07
MTSKAGDRIARRYLLQDVLGSGGMGVVWRALDERLRRQVAIKCARADDARGAQRLVREAQYAARVHHPNIVGVFDILDEGDTCWIVMEYVPSRSLAQLMAERGPLPPEEAGSIVGQIADALATSHEDGVVHGDVTPENILVTDKGIARLTDFGIARALWSEVTQDSLHTTTGAVRGKPRYLAPEAAKGQAPDKKADVFSLGASLYAAVEGHSPYGEFEHVMGYLARALEGQVEPPQQAGPLTETLTALLDVDPRRRPDAAEARKLLMRVTPPPPHIQEYIREHLRTPEQPQSRHRPAQGQPGDRRTLGLTRRTMRLTPPTIRLRRQRQQWPSRRTLAATAAVTVVGALVVGLAVLAPWGSDDRGGSQAKAPGAEGSGTSAAERDGAMGDAQRADPCKLLDAASLSRFGQTQLDPSYGALNRCDALVQHSGEDVSDVQVVLDNGAEDVDGSDRVRRVGNVRIATMDRTGDQCRRFIATPDHHEIVVIGKRLEARSADPCDLADAAADHVVGVLDKGPVPRRSAPPAAASLARLDACALLGTGAFQQVPGLEQRPSDRGFGNWQCEWSSPDRDAAFVQLQFTQDNDLDDNGKPASVAGTASHVNPKEEGDDSCVVYTPHRAFTNSVGDRSIELFRLTVRERQQSTTKVCDAATTLAAAAVKSIAAHLPAEK